MSKLSYKDLAHMTDYTYSSIKVFMCGARESEKVAKAIPLQINRYIVYLKGIKENLTRFYSLIYKE